MDEPKLYDRIGECHHCGRFGLTRRDGFGVLTCEACDSEDDGSFPKRVVLAEGYPWAIGTGPYYEIRMDKDRMAGSGIAEIRFPDELWSPDLPPYRLVLERIDDR